ncbi:MAG: TonB-dependent receptor [Gemmatimonadales bacterium]
MQESILTWDLILASPIARPTSRRRFWFAFLFLCVLSQPAAAQQDSLRGSLDSLRRINLSEVVIVASPNDPTMFTYTYNRISLQQIKRHDATMVSDFARLIPSAHVQTNSRGETLVYLRDAGERQVGLFFEGALLNIPWDNRIDLSLVPASVIGGMTVAKGVPPIEYGTNVLGGAVNLTARTADFAGSETQMTARYGSQDRSFASLTRRGTRDHFSYVGSVSYSRSDGLALSSEADLPFSQPDDDIRTNTGSRIFNLFAHGSYDVARDARIGLTLMHADARKGVAPEGHLDPAVSRVRFWRYPDWRNTVAILSSDAISGSTVWKGSAWVSSFSQTIDSYTSASFDSLKDREDDDDLTVGARFTLTRPLLIGSMKVAANWLTSTHWQRDQDLEPDGRALPGSTPPRLEFQQHLLSVGGEYEFTASPGLEVNVGASFDAMFAPKTGDKPDIDAFTDYTVTLGTIYHGNSGWFVRTSVGRKTRFPTMRELFGQALNRFLINPDLRPESSTQAELGLGARTPAYSGEIIPFATFTSNTIDQEVVLVEGETRPRRRRINLRGSKVIGLEIVAATTPVSYLKFEGHLTLLNVRRRRETDADPTRIAEKPNALGRFTAEYTGHQGTSVVVETEYTGRAYSLNDFNEFVPLNTSVVLNLRVGQQLTLPSYQVWEVFVRGDNVTDDLVLPQLGLPAAGRTWSGGLNVTF